MVLVSSPKAPSSLYLIIYVFLGQKNMTSDSVMMLGVVYEALPWQPADTPCPSGCWQLQCGELCGHHLSYNSSPHLEMSS